VRLVCVAVGDDFAGGRIHHSGRADERSVVCWFDAGTITTSAEYGSRHLALKATGLEE
jgi:hypothetical protein